MPDTPEEYLPQTAVENLAVAAGIAYTSFSDAQMRVYVESVVVLAVACGLSRSDLNCFDAFQNLVDELWEKWNA